MNGNEAFDQLKIKIRRAMVAYREGNNSSLIDMAENGQFLYDELEELMNSVDRWEVER